MTRGVSSKFSRSVIGGIKILASLRLRGKAEAGSNLKNVITSSDFVLAMTASEKRETSR